MTEWMTPGAKVAVLDSLDGQPYGSVTLATIKTVGKRDIVLDNGARFNRAQLVQRPGGTWSRRTVELVSGDDPKVVRMRTANRIQNTRSAVRKLTDGLARALRDDDWRKASELADQIVEALADLEAER